MPLGFLGAADGVRRVRSEAVGAHVFFTLPVFAQGDLFCLTKGI